MLDPRAGRGFFNTFHARYPFLRYPLDNVFHEKEFALVELERMPAFGSDHFPILVRLNLLAKESMSQSPIQRDEEDADEVEETLEKGRKGRLQQG